MKKEDFMSINAVHNPIILSLFSKAIDGEMTKSEFVEKFCAALHKNDKEFYCMDCGFTAPLIVHVPEMLF